MHDSILASPRAPSELLHPNHACNFPATLLLPLVLTVYSSLERDEFVLPVCFMINTCLREGCQEIFMT